MKRGFTLIELLAVIVVLAVIASIATPILTNLTKDSEKKTKEASIDLYGKAANQAVLVYEVENKISAKDFEDIEPYIKHDGSNVSCSTKLLNKDSSVYLNECSVDGELIEGYSFGVDKRVCKPITGDKNTLGSKFSCEVKPGTSYNFYVLSHEDDGTTNLIMDQNINSDGTGAGSTAIVKDGDNVYNLVQWSLVASNETGPVTAIEFLYNATKDWVNIEPLNYVYNDIEYQNAQGSSGGYTSFISNNGIATITPLSGDPTIIGTEKIPLRARMPIYSTNYLNDLDKKEFEKGDVADKKSDGSNDYLYYNHGLDKGDEEIGYWTLSSCSYDGMSAYVLYYDGVIDGDVVVDYFNVRPVINIEL